MIKVFDIIDRISAKLDEHSAIIEDYHIVLKRNGDIGVYIRSSGDISDITNGFAEYSDFVDFNVISGDDDDDGGDASLFASMLDGKGRVDISTSRRHLSNLLEPIPEKKNKTFVATFYSYKGGVGRSTALASCAAYLALNHGKKVVVLDCDFEAPGFTNFYVDDYSSPMFNNGLVEYFIDSQYETPALANYYVTAPKKFSGQGEIYVFPSGNLEDMDAAGSLLPTNRSHYLNGLARLDTMSPETLVECFGRLFDEIDRSLHPDAILIDSRTGFNDLFGVSAFRLSNMVVGFFGSDLQTKPGLHFFLDMLAQPNSPSLVAVNSIIPPTHKSQNFGVFADEVDEYILSSRMLQHDGDPYVIEKRYISANPVLSEIGKPGEDSMEYISLIKDRTFPEYNSLFDLVNDKVDEFRMIAYAASQPIKVSGRETTTTNSEIRNLKESVLASLKNGMPHLYAEGVSDFGEELSRNRYFFRSCMVELFNPSKILILGNKGTGKTYIYRSLKEKCVVEKLQKLANKDSLSCQFLLMVDDDKRFETIKFDNTRIESNDYFYQRFWTVYIWNSIMQERPYGYNSTLHWEPIKDDAYTAKRLLDLIEDSDKFIEIERDIQSLDAYLAESQQKLIIIFDELDQIVKPDKWSERISPLINLCRKSRYSSIMPKLFLRSDLFEKITNLNNKNELQNRSISIEWSREELFAYFFKLVLSTSKEQFFKLMRLYKDFPPAYTKKVMKAIEANNNQPPLDDYTLRHLCSTFFGRYADEDNSEKYGESYDWIFRNLRNANDTISLRPFIDLINQALQKAIAEDKSEKPILPQKYYINGSTRANAVERHFKDLAGERGNEDLMPIFDYIRDKAPAKYKKENLLQSEMCALLDLIIAEGKLKDNKDRDSIISLLEVNGIVRSKVLRVRSTPVRNYQFAYLYKYFLGLKSKDSLSKETRY